MDTLLYKGSEIEIKHLSGTLYEVKGALVLFGSPKESDFVKDFFAADTDYDLDEEGKGESSVYFNHGLDEVIGKARLGKGKAQLSKDDKAVWIKHQLDQAQTYDAMVLELLQKRKSMGKSFGWSSGAAASHLVEREPVGGARKIMRWPLGADASITLIPNDWRQTLIDVNELKPSNIKSLLEQEANPEDESEAHERSEADNTASSATNTNDTPTAIVKSTIQVVGDSMADELNQQTPAPVSAIDAEFMKRFNEQSEQLKKLMDVVENSPRLARHGYYTSDGGAADPNIKSVGDLLMAVKRQDIKRLETIYQVKAQTEGSGVAGGYLVPQQVLNGLDMPLDMTSGISNLVTRIPVTSPAGEAPIRDFSRTPTASAGNSASAQGIESQKRAEGGSYGAETIYFEMLNWKVSDFASGVLKASREIMEDAPMLETMLRAAIQEDVANREEYGILRGNGVAQPLGVLNWAGRVQVNEAGADNFGVADMDNMVSRLLRRGGGRFAWVYHPFVYTEVAALERGTGGAVLHNIKDALPQFLSGLPQFMSQHLPAIGTDGYIVLGDWSQYFLFERGGLYINFSEHRYADEGNVAWFFGKRIDGKPAMTSAVTLADGTSQLSPFVVINKV
jgi:HK97 family phage major capsid protein